MSAAAPRKAIGTVILAAGESTRMGQPKQILPYRGMTLLRATAVDALALDAGPVAVVLGAFSELFRPHLQTLPVRVVENPDWREGMGTSVRVGLHELLQIDPTLEAVLFLLCDQPLVRTTALLSLLEAHQATGELIIAAEYSGTLGVPAIFAQRLFAELLALSGNEGARSVIQKHRAETTAVSMPAAAIDIDTQADFAALPPGKD